MSQIAFNESFDLPIQHGLHIAGLEIGSMILDHLVRLEDITSYLVAPCDFALLAVQLGNLGITFLLFEHIQFRLEHLHRLRPVLMLAPFVLALHHDAGRLVRNPYRRAGLVDMLSAGPAGTIKVNSNVILIYINVNIIFK